MIQHGPTSIAACTVFMHRRRQPSIHHRPSRSRLCTALFRQAPAVITRDKNAPLACKEQQVIISKSNRPHSCECTPADQQPCAPTFTSAPHNSLLVQTIKRKQPSSQSCSGSSSSSSLPRPLTSHQLSSAPRCHRPKPSACGWWPNTNKFTTFPSFSSFSSSAVWRRRWLAGVWLAAWM